MSKLTGFVLNTSETYWYPVIVEMLDEQGKEQRFTFDAQFVRLTTEEVQAIFRPDGEKLSDDSEIMDRVFRGWRKVSLPDGSDLPVTPENRAQLLGTYPVMACVTRAWLKSVGIEGQRKN